MLHPARRVHVGGEYRPAIVLASLLPLLAGISTRSQAQQLTATLDAGASLLRYSDSLSTSAVALSPALALQTDHFQLNGAGTIAELGTNAWTGQGSVDAGVRTPFAAGLGGELTGAAGGSAHQDGDRTGQFQGVARLYFERNHWGLWGGAGAARAWDGLAWHSVRLGDAGAWLSAGSVLVAATATPSAVGDSLRYTDFGLNARWSHGRALLEGTFGARNGRGLVHSSGHTAWGSLGVVLWVAPHVGIAASGGSYAADLMQALPNGRFLSLAVRFSALSVPGFSTSSPGGRATVVHEDDRSAPLSPAVNARQLTVTRSDSMLVIRLLAPGVRTVVMQGDLTNWSSLALTAVGDGWWEARVAAPSGAHQLAIRLDGGPWSVPPGLVPVMDEFGGAAGMLDAP
ncbi:MAG: glycogen-binding domain-containing protein [Gemmatimonadaceae bacterium]